MKTIEEVRIICGHYYQKPEYKKLLGEHRCHYKIGNRCPEKFKDCPLYALVKRDKNN